MKKTKHHALIIWCVVISLILPIALPVLASADIGNTLIKIGGVSREVSLEPYENDLGLMVKANDISEAFGYDYSFDDGNKAFEIIGGAYGKVTLMHNATKFYSGEHEFECKPYFYVENGVPMVEAGFFCEMFNSSYEYDEENKIIEIFKDMPKYTLANDDEIAEYEENQSKISLFSTEDTRTAEGKIILPNNFEHKTNVNVKLSVKPYKSVPSTEMTYGGHWQTVWHTYYGTSIDLGEVTIPGGDSEQSYSFNFKTTSEMTYEYRDYKVSCAVTKDDSRKLDSSGYAVGSNSFYYTNDAQVDFELRTGMDNYAFSSYEDYYKGNKSFSFKIRDIEKMSYSDTNIFKIQDSYDSDVSYTTDSKGYAKVPIASYTVSADGYMPFKISSTTLNEHFFNRFVMYKTDYSDKPEVHAAYFGSANVFYGEKEHFIYSGDTLTKSIISAVINTNGKGIESVTAIQGSESIKLSYDSSCGTEEVDGKEYETRIYKSKAFNPGMTFAKVGEPIYLIIKTTEGDETKAKLDIKCVEQAKQDIPIDMGDELSFESIESDKNFLGDMNFKYKFFDKLPAKFTVEPESAGHFTFKGTLGVESEDEEKSYGTVKDAFAAQARETYIKNNYDGKNAAQKFDNFFKKLADKNLTSMDMMPEAEFGFDAKLKLFGYVEGSFDLQNDGFYDTNFTEGGLAAKLSFESEVKRQRIWMSPSGPVPVYWVAGLELANGITVPLVGENGKFTVPEYVTNETEIKIKGGGGVGIVDLATIGASAEGKLTITCTIPLSKEQTTAVLNGQLNLFDYQLGIAEGTLWKIPTKDLQLYPEVKVIDPNETKSKGMEQLPRAYTLSPMSFNPQAIEFMAADDENKSGHIKKTTIAENTYTFSKPTIIPVPNTSNEMIMAWVEDERGRESDADRTAVYYSHYDGLQWSEPQIVFDDTKADFNPHLKTINDNLYLYWSNASENFAFGENDITKIAKTLTTSVAKWNGTDFDILEQIDNNGVILADICEVDGNTVLAWTESASGDINQSSGDTVLKKAILTNSKWSIDTLLSNQKAIDGLSVSDIDGKIVVFYSQDTDGDISTIDDKEVFAYTGNKKEQITKNDIADTKPQIAGDNVYWYSDGDIVFQSLSDSSESGTISADMLSDKFIVCEGENTKKIIYSQIDSDGKNAVYAVCHDGKGWAMPVKITATEDMLGGYDALMDNDGSTKIITNEIAMSDDEFVGASINMYEFGDYTDITLESIDYNEYSTDNGNLQLYFDLTNNGTELVDQVTVYAYDENDEILDYTTIDTKLLPGETYSYKARLYEWYGFEQGNIRIEVKPYSYGVTDVNTDDNSLAITFKNQDISVEEISHEKQDDKTIISAYIVNRGQGDISNANVSLKKGSVNGEVINTITTETIESKDYEYVEFEVDSADKGIYYITCDEIENESLLGNNSDFVMIADDITPEDLILTPCFTVEYKDGYANVTNYGEKDEKVAVIVADYNNDGELKNVSSQRLEFKASETRQFPLSGDNSRVFVWNSLRGMFPMTK